MTSQNRLDAVTSSEDKANAILSLSTKAARVPAMFEQLKGMLTSEDQLIRFTAARALARAVPEEAPPDVISVLLQALQDPKSLRVTYDKLKGRGYDVIHDASLALCLVGRERASEIIPYFLEALDKHTGFNAASMAHALLYLAFHGKPVSKDTRYSEMTEQQQQILKYIVESRRAWRYGGNLAESLSYFGLPETRETLTNFLNS